MAARERDIPYEDCVSNDPYNVESWVRYLRYKESCRMTYQDKGEDAESVGALYERAITQLPGSYKLWKTYIDFKETFTNGESATAEDKQHQHTEVSVIYERCLVFMSKMPRVWIRYIEHLYNRLGDLCLGRKVFNECLRTLPLEQHKKVWEAFLANVVNKNRLLRKETKIYFLKRYLVYEPQYLEEFICVLVEDKEYEKCIPYMKTLINRHIQKKTSNFSLYKRLIELFIKHAPRMGSDTNDMSLDLENIIKQCLIVFRHERVFLWTSLANYYIKFSRYEKAIDIYEECIEHIDNVKEFSQVFEIYTRFGNGVIELYFRNKQEVEEELRKNPESNYLKNVVEDINTYVELMIIKFDNLVAKRTLLMNDCKLRNNIDNIDHWKERVDMVDPSEKTSVYLECFGRVHPKRVIGDTTLSSLWLEFVEHSKKCEKYQFSKIVDLYEKAMQVNYKDIEESGNVLISYAGYVKTFKGIDASLELISAFVNRGRPIYDNVNISRSLNAWTYYIGLEKEKGGLETVVELYERLLSLKIITPNILFEYCNFLESHGFYERSFSTYERGVVLFAYPIAFDIYNVYMPKLIQQYGGDKIERYRETMDNVIEKDPPLKYFKRFIIMYANMEEKFGLIKNCYRIYISSIRRINDYHKEFHTKEKRLGSSLDKFDTDNEIYKGNYNQKEKCECNTMKSEIFGIVLSRHIRESDLSGTRNILEMAIDDFIHAFDSCFVNGILHFSIMYFNLEMKLGEVERARKILEVSSIYSNPYHDTFGFWKVWQNFELKCGNRSTFKDLLKVKRSVSRHYQDINTAVEFVSEDSPDPDGPGSMGPGL